MLKIFAVVVVVTIGVVLILAAMKPDTFRVERSAVIKAPPDKVFALLSDFHTWGSWSPWEKLDPTMKRTFSGPVKGLGTLYEWEGNKKVGQGSMEITEATPPTKIKLDFLKPFEAHNTCEFTLVPQGNSTQVTWAMYGPNNYMAKIMHVFMNMDKMVGNDFDTGLANLKALAEK